MNKRILFLFAIAGCAGAPPQVESEPQPDQAHEVVYGTADCESPWEPTGIAGECVRVAEPGEMPAYLDTYLFMDKGDDPMRFDYREVRKAFNPDGSEWVAPVKDKIFSAYWCANQTTPCPCSEMGGGNGNNPVGSDPYGNLIVQDGTCAVIDGGTVTFDVVKAIQVVGKTGGMAINHTVEASYADAGFNNGVQTQISTMINGCCGDPKARWPYVIGYQAGREVSTQIYFPKPGFHYPSGWYDLNYTTDLGVNAPSYLVPFPTTNSNYLPNTDIVMRNSKIAFGNGWYQANLADTSVAAMGLTRAFFARGNGGQPLGIATDFGQPLVFSWKPTIAPTGNNPTMLYLKISGSLITIDVAGVKALGTDALHGDYLLEHATCHEWGHAMGLGHENLQGTQDNNCMSERLDVSDQNHLSYSLGDSWNTLQDAFSAQGIYPKLAIHPPASDLDY